MVAVTPALIGAVLTGLGLLGGAAFWYGRRSERTGSNSDDIDANAEALEEVAESVGRVEQATGSINTAVRQLRDEVERNRNDIHHQHQLVHDQLLDGDETCGNPKCPFCYPENVTDEAGDIELDLVDPVDGTGSDDEYGGYFPDGSGDIADDD